MHTNTPLTSRPRTTVAALTTGLILAGSATAGAAANPQDADAPSALETRVAELEAELARFRGQDDWAATTRADEIRSVISDVLADADTRTSSLQSGMKAGWDNGFTLGSADGSYTLNISGLIQVRYIHSLRDNSADDSVGGFENQRTYLTFSGNIVDPTWVYKVQGGFNTNGGGFTLLDAYAAKVLDNGWILGAGQVKVPSLRESNMDEQFVQGTSRSLLSDEFDPMRTQGIILMMNYDRWNAKFALTDGHDATGGSNTPWNTYDVEYSITGRGEFLVAGEWAQFKDMTSAPDSDYGLMIGVGAHYQAGEFGTTANEIDAFQANIDVSAEFDGGNVFAAYVFRDTQGTATDTDAQGFLVQGGYYLADDLELYGRFEWLDNDVDADALSVLTVGVNKYFAGNQMKVSADIGYAFDEVTAFWGNGALGVGGATNGWQTDAAGEDGQLIFRLQSQLTF